MQEIQKGDIFYTSWGYDQTNYDFIVVVGFTPSKKSAKCQQAKIEDLGTKGQQDIVKPKAKGIGKTFNMKIQNENGGEPTLRGTYYKTWNEKSEKFRLDTFYKAKDKMFYPTNTMYGH